MVALAQQHPGYGWDSNAGYGTKAHQDGLAKHGVTQHHRRSFAPIRKMLCS
jgi:ribonuclease HII